MTSSVLLATDNGFIVKRDSSGVYTQVNSTGPGTFEADDIYNLLINQNNIFSVNYRIGATPNRYPILSTDDGITWTQYTANSVRHFATLPICVDDVGNLYSWSDFTGPNAVIYKSTDQGLTWTLLYDTGTDNPPINALCVAEGYIWYRELYTDTDLHRVNLDGTGHISFASGFPDTHQGVIGRTSTNRLYVGPFTPSPDHVWSVDITDPNVPVFTSSTLADPFSGEVAVWIQPLTNQIAVAYTALFNGAGSDKGSIWRTIDAGATWTRVVAQTADLAVKRNTAPFVGSAAPFTTNNLATDGVTVVVAGYVPYIYISTDLGVTFIEETCPLSLAPDADIHVWTSLALIIPECKLIIGTDNMLLVQRNAPNDYSILFRPTPTASWAISPFAFAIRGLEVTGDCLNTRFVASQRASNGPYLYMDDCDGTITPVRTGTGTSIFIGANIPSHTPPINDTDPHLLSLWQQTVPLMDDDGLVYDTVSWFSSGQNRSLVKTDPRKQTDTWTVVCDLGPTTGFGLAIGDSPDAAEGTVLAKDYFWWMPAQKHNGANTNFLYRLNKDGSAIAHYTIPWAANDVNDALFGAVGEILWGYSLHYNPVDAPNIITAHPLFPIRRLSNNALEIGPTVVIDISNPSLPTFTFSAWNAFGSKTVVQDIRAISDTVIYARAITTTDILAHPNSFVHGESGSLWKSTDSGATWSNIIPDTAHLGMALASTVTPSGFPQNQYSEGLQSLANNGNDLFIVGAPPYVEHLDLTTDTWTEETIDPAIYTPYIVNPSDSIPTQYDSIAFCCSCNPGGGPPIPELFNNFVIVTLVGAT